MISVKIPDELPDCKLIHLLAEKVGQRKDTDFDFFGELNRFRQHVSEEVHYINELFPEYTPHDEKYHLKRLFHVAETVLGQELMESMNSAELLVLACGLYGHDWGMAVSKDEKDYIVSGQLKEGRKSDDFWLLPNERDRFVRFAKNCQIEIDNEGHAKDISIEDWREYVRKTHAFRSAERVRRYFEAKGDVSDAVGRVCAGHWLSFEELRDYKTYPIDFSVLRETVNLRALAVYIRLIDMLDLAEDRTPYIIWKFVAPRDPKSKMEWAKHRALRPVTCPPYQNGRIIMVDGSTNDHEVYAALEDLRNWCQEQFKGCNDLLAQMNDPRHKLDIYHIDWRVAAQEFEPFSVRFEFDRERMFEILSEEIYQDDPYVFLRELLQNSIDAIRMRREVLKRKGIDPVNLGVIKVDVKHEKGGNAVIEWRDDGIGMDEYVIKNYLAMAGKSYYQSEDFMREGLEMDPISRFGVGILSCFMISDRVQIETFKDPYFGTVSHPLKITIPAVKRQFRIEKKSSENAIPGTTFRVFVDKRKLPVEKGQDDPKPLDVTEYLSIVAGFVEFPIIINEGDRKTIILHPRQDPAKALERFGEAFRVQQLDLRYPWAEAILPQDLSIARECAREKRLDIAFDLGLDEYDGTLTYLVPVSKEIDFERQNIYKSKLKGGASFGWHNKTLRWSNYWSSHENGNPIGISRSSNHPARYSVYRDGILLATLDSGSYPEFGQRYGGGALPPPRLVINLPKSRTPKVDLARTQVVGQKDVWFKPLLKAHVRCVYDTLAKELASSKPDERMFNLARLFTFDKIAYDNFYEVFPKENWPLVFVGNSGQIYGKELSKVENETLCLCPEFDPLNVSKILSYRFLNLGDYDGPAAFWAGEGFVPCYEIDDISYIGFDSGIETISHLCERLLHDTHIMGGIRFLSPPWEGNPPLLQKVLFPLKPAEMSLTVENVLQKMFDDPAIMEPAEIEFLRRKMKEDNRERQFSIISGKSLSLPWLFNFGSPFDRYFAYGWRVLNLKHPSTQAILKAVAHLLLAKIHNALTQDTLGLLYDSFNSIPFNTYFYYDIDEFEWEKGNKKLRHFFEVFNEMKLYDFGDIQEIIPSTSDFIPGTIFFDSDSRELLEQLELRLEKKAFTRTFGMALM